MIAISASVKRRNEALKPTSIARHDADRRQSLHTHLPSIHVAGGSLSPLVARQQMNGTRLVGKAETFTGPGNVVKEEPGRARKNSLVTA